jgi:nucleoside-diphosphate-sugar epimerase
MGNALIGFSGFVGGHLDRQLSFESRFNSGTIERMRGKTFETVFCAGVSAIKWLANKEPEKDLHGMVSLLTSLESIRAERFVLISTIDVYADPVGVDEDTVMSTEGLHPYGTHRRLLETFVQERFPLHHIVRLPGLFGDGLKKNVIYDLLHDHEVENINGDAVFQFYNLAGLTKDIGVAINNDLRVVNFATEPITVKDLAACCFDRQLPPGAVDNPPRYDMKTRHAPLFGATGDYLYSRRAVFDDLKKFIHRNVIHNHCPAVLR